MSLSDTHVPAILQAQALEQERRETVRAEDGAELDLNRPALLAHLQNLERLRQAALRDIGVVSGRLRFAKASQS